MKVFNLPDLGEGLQEAEIVAWHVAEGDRVVADQPLVSVETEKAVVEVPSPVSGRIARLCAKPGERIKVGAPLVEFEEGERADTGAIVGELAPTPSGAPRAEKSAAPRTPASTRKAPQPVVLAVKAVPAARSIAQKLDIDLASVTPSGPDGTITVADVERAARNAPSLAAAPAADLGEALRGMRRAMAINMARSGTDVVPATVSDDAVIDWWTPDSDVTARLIRALVAGCQAAPALNAWFDGKSLTRRVHTQIDLGLAVDTPDGLLVPVLRNVAGLGATQLRQSVDAAKAAAKARALSPEEMRGPTITLSNFGTIAGRYGALIIMPPQTAILGAGRVAEHVAFVEGKPARQMRLPLSLTFDHRAVTGGEAARFVAAVIGDLSRSE